VRRRQLLGRTEDKPAGQAKAEIQPAKGETTMPCGGGKKKGGKKKK